MRISSVIADPTTDSLPLYDVTVDDPTGQLYFVQVHAETAAEASQAACAFLAAQHITVRQVYAVEPSTPRHPSPVPSSPGPCCVWRCH